MNDTNVLLESSRVYRIGNTHIHPTRDKRMARRYAKPILMALSGQTRSDVPDSLVLVRDEGSSHIGRFDE